MKNRINLLALDAILKVRKLKLFYSIVRIDLKINI